MCDAAIAGHNAAKASKDPQTFDASSINAIAAAFNKLSNFQEDPNYCTNLVKGSDPNSESYAWNLQICGQLPMIQGGLGPSIFWQPNFYEAGYNKTCMDTFGTTPNYPYALDQFGGRIPEKDYYSYSNIILSNGLNDPWSRGGILSDISPDIQVLPISNAAHHQDLRLPIEATDPPSIKDARKKELETITMWINDWKRGYASTVY